MLNTVWLGEKRNTDAGTAMLLGGFDGLHIGHRRLLSCAKKSGLPVGIMTIVGGKEEKHLFTFSEREKIFQNAGADFVFELPFSEIKDLSPTDFLELLQRAFSPKLFVCGEDFRFGYQAQGTPEMIKRATHVRVEVQPLVEINGEKVSSTYIKALLKAGAIEKANALLGEPFFIGGEVRKDRGVGRTIGFPTANIAYDNQKFPIKEGVYQTRTEVDGKDYQGITNYGGRPTFDNARICTETYLDGFEGDLYGKTLCVRFIKYLRDIKKFDNAEQLKGQLTKDIERIREHD